MCMVERFRFQEFGRSFNQTCLGASEVACCLSQTMFIKRWPPAGGLKDWHKSKWKLVLPFRFPYISHNLLRKIVSYPVWFMHWEELLQLAGQVWWI